MEISIHAEYQNSMRKHVLPRPSHGTLGTVLRFEKDITAKKVYELLGKSLLNTSPSICISWETDLGKHFRW